MKNPSHSDYDKYKERSPQDTVFEIQRILNGIGLFPLIQWTGDAGSGTHSCRVTLWPTSSGANGKGTDELYCTASGMAELMERLQNNAVLYCPNRREDLPACGFSDGPDEKKLPLKEILSHPDPYTEKILSLLREEDEFSNGEALCRLLSSGSRENPSLTVAPYADLETGQTVWLPLHLVRLFNCTNGMAAGNTLEEATVQGLSELVEREVNWTVLEGRAVPPEIPDEALEQYSFYPLIRELRSKKQYRVSLLDCSLGKGWPVVALCIRNLERGTFGLRFGAHPSFPVAVERTLTEAAQGHSLDRFSGFCRIGGQEEVLRRQNLVNIATDGSGLYPVSLFTEKPGWEFRPWTRFQGKGNHEFLREMINLLTEEGYRILVRDVSFLGFPSCHIVIPCFREMKPVTGTAVRLRRSTGLAAASWQHFPKLSKDEAARILRLIRYYEGSAYESAMKRIIGLPLSTSAFSDDRVGAYLALQLQDLQNARHFFGKLLQTERSAEERQYYACMKEYCDRRCAGLSHGDAITLVSQFHPEEGADRACRELDEIQFRGTLPESVFPKLKCPDCDSCTLAGNGCNYRVEAEVYRKVMEAMKR